MTDEMIALARRAVACKGWKWMAGMRTNSKFARVVAVDSDTGFPCAAEQGATNDDCHAVWLDGVPLLPDLTDPATMGCLLALVREARDDTTLGVIRQDLGTMRSKEAWFICGEGGADDVWAHTEIDALLDALEVA